MATKRKITNKNLDIARVAFGAYQSYGSKPAMVEVLIYEDGSSIDLVYGQVNPCKFGDQCEGHSCYCNHPKAQWRKCHRSWYLGIKKEDSQCELYEPNPYWQDGKGDFYQQREQTLLYLKEQNLLEINTSKLTATVPTHHKGKKTKFI